MSDVKYTYAVARIRAMEMSLFNSAMIEQLLAMKDYDACLQFLAEKGWGDPDTPMDAEAILSREDLECREGADTGRRECARRSVLPESVPQFKGGHQGERHRKELRKGLL